MSDYPRGPRNHNNQGSNFQGPFSSRPQGSRSSAPRSGESPRQSSAGARSSSSRSERGTSSYQAMNSSRSNQNQGSSSQRSSNRSFRREDSDSRPIESYRDSETSYRQTSSARERTRETEAYNIPSRSRSERNTLSRSSQVEGMSRSRSGNKGRGGASNSGGSNNKFLQAIRWDVWGKYVNWKTMLALVGIPFLCGLIYIGYLISQVPDIANGELRKTDAPSTVYDANGTNVIAKIGTRKIEPISLKDLMKKNPKLPATLVKVEDQRFWDHDGIDMQGLARAVVDNLKGGSGGGGTIPMQVARNIVLDAANQKTLQRKVNEMVSAQQLIEKHRHEGVLEAYLNYIDFGPTIQGVQAASKFYFGKDLTKDQLTDEEVALLVAIPNNPTRFNPKGSEEQQARAKDRRDWILKKKMTNSEDTSAVISMAEADAATTKPLGIKSDDENPYLKEFKVEKHTAYLDLVRSEVTNRYPITKEDLRTKAYKIKVAIDPRIDQIVEEEIKTGDYFKGKSIKEKLNSSFAILDRKNGRVIAVAGGRNYIPGNNNWAYIKQQPGSTIKPLSVFAPYIEMHKDENPDKNEYSQVNATKFESKSGWKPKDFSGEGTDGPVQLKEAVARSSNQAAARLLIEDVTLGRAVNYLENKFQLPLDTRDHESPAAIALGGLTKGLSPIQMAQAFSVFPNNGKFIKAHAVLEVQDKDGKVIQPKPEGVINENEPTEVLSEKTSYYMTRILKEVVDSPVGTGKGAKIQGFDVAGKTGTTQQERAGWFVGFTPDYVASAVIFNEYDKGGWGNTTVTGGYTAKMWGKIMAKIVDDNDQRRFEKPAGVPEPVPPFQLQQFDFNIMWNGQGIKINIAGPEGVADPRVLYTVERWNNGKYEQVTQGNANNLVDSSAPVDPNNPGQTYKYRVTATIGNDQSVKIPVERELQLQGLQPQQPEQPCDPSLDPNCKPDPNNPGNGGQDPGGDLKPRDCLKEENRNTPYCQQVAQECALDPNKYAVCPLLNSRP